MSETARKILLLTGATGFLGRRLAAGLAADWRVVGASRSGAGPDFVRLDLEDPDSIRRVFDTVRPAAVIHAGAMAEPDPCEREPEKTLRVNRDATRVLAGQCGGARARLLFLSTDLVFDGEKGWYSEDDTPNPLSVYARSKLEAEEAVLALAPGASVLRVSSCYGRPLGGRAGFVDELQVKLSRGEPVSAFTDQWRSSTAADQLPGIVARLLADSALDGVFHWGGAERATRHAVAAAFARAMGYDESLVRPARATDRKFLAARPRDCSMDSSRLATALGVAPMTLAEGFAALKGAWSS